DATAVIARPALDDALERFGAAAAGRPAVLLSGAERTLAFVRPADHQMIDRGLAWLQLVPDGPSSFSRDAARVRLLVGGERWEEALFSVSRLAAAYPSQPAAARLHAQVLSWAGHHNDALKAYDAYLASSPDDLEARREQARVAGWAARSELAKRFYASLAATYPANAAVSAEAIAKSAFLSSHWRAAVAGYSKWVAL